MAHLFKRVVVAGLVLAGDRRGAGGGGHVPRLRARHERRRVPERMAGPVAARPTASARATSARAGRSSRCATAPRCSGATSPGTSMFAGAGARFTGFSIKSHGTAQNGTTWQMAMCADAVRELPAALPAAGHVGRDRDRSSAAWRRAGRRSTRTHLWAGVSCDDVDAAPTQRLRVAPCRSRTWSRTRWSTTTRRPARRSLGGVSTGWNSGQKQLAYSASDAGSGVESVDADGRRLAAPHDQPLVLAAAVGRVHAAGAVRDVDERDVHAERAGAARGWPAHAVGHVARRRRRRRGESAGVLGGQQRAGPSARARRSRAATAGGGRTTSR